MNKEEAVRILCEKWTRHNEIFGDSNEQYDDLFMLIDIAYSSILSDDTYDFVSSWILKEFTSVLDDDGEGVKLGCVDDVVNYLNSTGELDG